MEAREAVEAREAAILARMQAAAAAWDAAAHRLLRAAQVWQRLMKEALAARHRQSWRAYLRQIELQRFLEAHENFQWPLRRVQYQ